MVCWWYVILVLKPSSEDGMIGVWHTKFCQFNLKRQGLLMWLCLDSWLRKHSSEDVAELWFNKNQPTILNPCSALVQVFHVCLTMPGVAAAVPRCGRTGWGCLWKQLFSAFGHAAGVCYSWKFGAYVTGQYWSNTGRFSNAPLKGCRRGMWPFWGTPGAIIGSDRSSKPCLSFLFNKYRWNIRWRIWTLSLDLSHIQNLWLSRPQEPRAGFSASTMFEAVLDKTVLELRNEKGAELLCWKVHPSGHWSFSLGSIEYDMCEKFLKGHGSKQVKKPLLSGDFLCEWRDGDPEQSFASWEIIHSQHLTTTWQCCEVSYLWRWWLSPARDLPELKDWCDILSPMWSSDSYWSLSCEVVRSCLIWYFLSPRSPIESSMAMDTFHLNTSGMVILDGDVHLLCLARRCVTVCFTINLCHHVIIIITSVFCCSWLLCYINLFLLLFIIAIVCWWGHSTFFQGLEPPNPTPNISVVRGLLSPRLIILDIG